MKYTKEILEEAVKQNTTYAGVIKYLGKKQSGGFQSYIKMLILKNGIDISHFKSGPFKLGNKPCNKIHKDQILVYDRELQTRTDRNQLKRAMIESGIKYECKICHNNGTWLGEKLSLQIDHISGNWSDNRIDNLRFLCPNCHTQTPTYSSKRLKKCKNQIKKPKPRPTKIVWPSIEEISKLVWLKPTSILAKELGVTDTAITKFCKKNNIPKPPRGYWAKKLKECSSPVTLNISILKVLGKIHSSGVMK